MFSSLPPPPSHTHTHSSPWATTTWEKDGIQLVSSQHVSFTQASRVLTLQPVAGEDRGRYTCIANQTTSTGPRVIRRTTDLSVIGRDFPSTHIHVDTNIHVDTYVSMGRHGGLVKLTAWHNCVQQELGGRGEASAGTLSEHVAGVAMLTLHGSLHTSLSMRVLLEQRTV